MNTARLLVALPMLAGLAACAHQAPVSPLAQFRTYAPASRTVAQLPRSDEGSSAYQGHDGSTILVGSAPALNDTGSERIPDYPSGAEPPVRGGNFQVIMPNGGERPVESVNSLPD